MRKRPIAIRINTAIKYKNEANDSSQEKIGVGQTHFIGQ
jgi:CRISPR/Cas system CMR-associated protein Cmr1 (group 7 of RAMP superfamily)